MQRHASSATPSVTSAASALTATGVALSPNPNTAATAHAAIATSPQLRASSQVSAQPDAQGRTASAFSAQARRLEASVSAWGLV